MTTKLGKRVVGIIATSGCSPPPHSAALTIKPRASVVKRPSPRLYFPHFVDHLNHFVVILKTFALERSLNDHTRLSFFYLSGFSGER
jgi:hypothetical protein